MSRRSAACLVLVGVACVVPTVFGQGQAQWQDVIRNLRHPNAEVRLEAVDRLGSAGYVAAIESVAPLLADPDDRVQAAALEAELTFFLTERIGGTRILGVGSSKSRAQLAFEAGPLIRTSTPAPLPLIDALIGAMRDENPRVRFDAIHALGFIAESPLPTPQVRALAGEMDHYDPIIRAATARVIGRLRARDASDKLVGGLSDSNSVVRFYALESLGLVREERAIASLRDAVERGRPDEMMTLGLLSLARVAPASERDRFRGRLADKNVTARRAAVEGLGRLNDRDSSDAISKIFQNDRSAEVRMAAAFALQQMGQTQTHVLATHLVVEEVAAQARDYLFEIGRPAVPGVLSALKVATNSKHRADLIQVVGYLGTANDLPSVQGLLTDRDERVVRAATNATLRLKRQ